MIKYPINVQDIECDFMNSFEPSILSGGEIGDMVMIRPAGKEYDGKTFIGIFLGEAPIGVTVLYNEKLEILRVKKSHGNPAILVPELKKVIWGYESWWDVIESEEDLRQITDKDIENIWYVKTLKQLAAKEDSSENT